MNTPDLTSSWKKGAPKAGIIGWPVMHSRSPLIHTHWLTSHGLAGRYDKIPVSPDKITQVFSTFKSSGYVGANITIPHKEAIFPYLDQIDDAAKAIGAVNTIWLQDGDLHGTNTDWLGFLGNLDEQAPGWDISPDTALVLGAGGAARGVLYALIKRGYKTIYLANRTLGRAYDLQENFGDIIKPCSLNDADKWLPFAQLVVNTTSLGMEKNPPLALSLDKISSTCLVTDIVYTPLETPLLRLARERGNKTVDGLGMLLHQAAPGFKKWFGIQPHVTAQLRSLILKDMDLL